MARDGALQLHDYPGGLVRLACERCGRRGQYRKATLAARYGRDVTLPTLRNLIAQCPHHDALGTACAAHYVDLIPPDPTDEKTRRAG